MSSDTKRLDISSAIKRPGALNRRVKGRATQNIGKVKELAKSGSPLAKKQANFFLSKILPALKKKNKRKSLLSK